MPFLSIILFFIGLFAFFNSKKHLTLLIILILSSDYFSLVDGSFSLGPISLQLGDLALFLIFMLIPFRTKFDSKDTEIIKKALLIFTIFLIVSVSYDFLFRGTTIMQIFRTTRKLGYFMFFPLMASFSRKDYELLFKLLLYITVLHSLIYVLQYVLNIEVPGMTSYNIDGSLRYRNSPYYLIPVLIYMFYNQKKYKLSLYYIFLFVLVSVLTQSRGAIISVFSIFMIYFYHEEKIKIQSVILITLLLVTFYFIVNIYLPDLLIRFEEGLQQITNLNNINYNYNLTALRFQGTFIFRIGILYERFIFVLQHLSTIILGVGFIPDMDIMLPIFKLGTHSPTLPTGFEQFNTVDIFYPNIITRYGIIGSIIYLYILLQIGKYAILHRKYMWGKILLSYLFALVSISFINETFYNVQIFLIIFMMIGYIIHEKQNMTLTKSNNNKKKYA